MDYTFDAILHENPDNGGVDITGRRSRLSGSGGATCPD